MAEETKIGCARPTGGLVGEKPETRKDAIEEMKDKSEVKMAQVQVGKKAPDFKAPAYHRGKFINVQLSESLGKWVMLCFYPGDFTFV